MEDMNMKKILTHHFLGMALLASISGILLQPNNAYAAINPCGLTCDYSALIVLLPDYRKDLLGAKEQYAAIEDNIGIESALKQVNDAIAIAADTPKWVADGNVAMNNAMQVLDKVKTRTANSVPTLIVQNQRDADIIANPNSSPQAVAQAQARINQQTQKIALVDDKANGKTSETLCKGFLENAFNPICWIRMISVVIGTLLISVSALILAIADMLFNWSVDNTILLFSTAIFAKVADGVNVGWTAIRDIANIIIIGMFTFIAISTILGIQEYGAKKLLARVLIIAVLINFSLLFTKIIIDTSNFTAGQFYASATDIPLSQARDEAEKRSKPGATESTITIRSEGDSPFSFRKLGVSGAFIRFLGVTSVGSTYKGLDGIANGGGGWYVALGHGLLAAVLLGGAGLVLLYGVYLLISRAVLFIFLMITAAGAFATHLIPKMNESEYGWSGWWSSLLHNAALAPILMILLYITLKVSEAIAAKGSGTLGNLASPTKAGAIAGTDIGALFSYLIILGLLWGSFLLASKWASKVGGLKLTGSILSSMAVAPATLASRFVAAPLARKVIGGGAAAHP